MFSKTNGRHSLHIVRYAAIGIAVMLGLSWIVGFFQHHSPTSPKPTPTPTPHATPATPSPAGASPAHASSMVLPAGPITLPAQPEPPGLIPGHAQIALASAPDQQAPWVDLGAAVVTAPTASFTTKAPRALVAVAPSSGIMRLRWRGWIQAPTAGSYTLAASISSGAVGALDLRVDGIASPILSMSRNCGLWGDCPSTPTTGAGSVALAAGWHQIAVTIKTDAGSKADITIYMRSPGSDAPVVLVPSWPAGKAGAP